MATDMICLLECSLRKGFSFFASARLHPSVRDSYAGATKWAFAVQMGSFVVAFLGGLGMKEVDLDIEVKRTLSEK